METDPDPRQFRLGWPLVLCRPGSLEFGAQFLICFFSLIQRENWISRDFFCACLCASSFCQAFTLRSINYNHIQLQYLNPLDKDSVPLRSWHNPGPLRNPGSLCFSPPNIAQILKSTINLLSGHCPLVCMTSSYFLGKWSLIFLNEDICQLCVSI